MTDEILPISQTDPNLFSSGSSSSLTESNSQVNQQEFLELLVTQLQNQDPLNPMENEEFAVQLAQFSQVEQLISINEKLDNQEGSTDFSSLASYLGNQVVLNSDIVSVENGEGGDLAFRLGSDANNVEVELVDELGTVQETESIGALEKGSHTVSLNGLIAGNGEYQARVVAVGPDGARKDIEANVAGVVDGFVPGPEPVLVVGDREVSTADIKKVQLAK